MSNMKYVSIDDVSKLFHLPMKQAARSLGTCSAVVKRCCRQNGILRWPYRKLRSVLNRVGALPAAVVMLANQNGNAAIANICEFAPSGELSQSLSIPVVGETVTATYCPTQNLEQPSIASLTPVRFASARIAHWIPPPCKPQMCLRLQPGKEAMMHLAADFQQFGMQIQRLQVPLPIPTPQQQEMLINQLYLSMCM
eukprot:TRINITY_DN4933_c0_g1_i1.p1 TRINITY_DN4933_c0_g1~~TRINITY_DN4933_c0_g1_i1.p1  ORF type:complete len:196 (-),score=23.68 TRINITY_DN4933_c0_g1_i1:324-911(-)